MRGFVGLLPILLWAAAGASRGQEPATLDQRVHKTLERARKALERDLKRVQGDVQALVCLAARHDGMGADDPAFEASIARLAALSMSSTYGLAIRLMLLADYPQFPDRDVIARRDLAELLQRRGGGGGFSYGTADGWWDLSNTQYAALGLRAATALGLDVPREVWRSLLAEVMSGQKSDGGFSYRPDQGRTSAYSSMTVAGIAVLEICRQHLDLDPEAEADVEQAVADGWRWMADHEDEIGSKTTRSTLYFHYGLERAAILSDVVEVGGVDWYLSGAELIMKMQKRGGGFVGQNEMRPRYRSDGNGNPVDTAFAVLFLRKSFKRTLGPTTPAFSFYSEALPEQATDEQISAAVAIDVQRGMRAVPALLKALRSRFKSRRTAAAEALQRISGETFGYHPGRSAADNAQSLRRAERWWFQARYERAGKAGGKAGGTGDEDRG